MSNTDKVKQFHTKHDINKAKLPSSPNTRLLKMWNTLDTLSYGIEIISRQTNDPRYMRAALLIEECAEAVDALGEGDEVALLDALADIIYVAYGIGEVFNLPVQAAFDEVHRSNMTKSVTTDLRISKKGDKYSPPRLKNIIEEYRKC